MPNPEIERITLDLAATLSGDRGLSSKACKGIPLAPLILTAVAQLPRSANLRPSTHSLTSASKHLRRSSGSGNGDGAVAVAVVIISGSDCRARRHRLGTKVVYMMSRKWLVVPNVKSPRALAKALGMNRARFCLATAALRSGPIAVAVVCMACWPWIWMAMVSISNTLEKDGKCHVSQSECLGKKNEWFESRENR